MGKMDKWQIIGLAASVIGFACSMIGNITSDKHQDKVIEDKVAEAIANLKK